MKTIRLLLVALGALATGFAPASRATDTHFWQHGDRADFESGTLKNLSLRADGRIFLAPQFTEIFDSSTPYLWTMAIDSKGNLYTAGGGTGSGTAKVFVIDRNGKSRAFAELDGLEIHAIVLDGKDEIYAATDPDGKIYKIGSDGKPKLFYDPHQKYIWSMAFSSKGDLFVATGDQGEIHRVTPAGVGSVFFKTEETHARSLALDAEDNLIVGTEPSGLILRVSPAGQGFVLYQSPKREITAVAVTPDGAIYASGVGNKTAVAQAAPPPSTAPAIVLQGTSGVGNARVTPVTGGPGPSLAGGSEVYRINPDGSPRKVWSSAQDIVYAIGFDAGGLPLVGTGNRGKIYRLDSDTVSTLLLDASPTQVTGFGRAASNGSKIGDLYAITGNIGKVFRIGPGFEKNGSFESPVLDAGAFAYWGRVNYRGLGKITVSTRSGNRSHPESNWSPWTVVQADTSASACDSCGAGRTVSPSARFLQYKIDLTPAAGQPEPEVSYVEVAYLPKNVAPEVTAVDITPANYRFPLQSVSITPSTSITIPPIGQQKSSSSSSLEGNASQTLNYAKGFEGARWLASDENGDSLLYRVEIRGVKESGWKLLKENVKERYLSWDSTAFPDGEYVLRVTASDSPSNTIDQALGASLVSDPFLIDNTPPQIVNLTGAAAAGNKLEVRWSARDARSTIDHAEYSVNGAEWVLIDPVSRLSDSPQEEYHLLIDRPSSGEQVVAVRVNDEFDNQAVDKVVIK
jgi:sugar lactone lactonase YvrE